MPSVPISDVRDWIIKDPVRWRELAGTTAIGPSGRKTIWSASEREINYDKSGIDFDQTPTFWRKFIQLEVPQKIAERIDVDLAPQRARATARAQAKERKEAELAENRRKAMLAKEQRARDAARLLEEAREARIRHAQMEEENRRVEEAKKKLASQQELENLRAEYLRRSGQLEELISRRGIARLVHFTRLANIPTILQRGLVPRRENVGGVFNDGERLDYQLDCTSLSISFPNYKLFSKFRLQYPSEKWAVLLIHTSVLCDHLCLFNQTNAANSGMSCRSLSERSSLEAFENMFAETVPGPLDQTRVDRLTLGLVESHPTDPQAEVLVFGHIDPSNMLGIHVADSDARDELVNLISGVCVESPIAVDGRYFRQRADYTHWSFMAD